MSYEPIVSYSGVNTEDTPRFLTAEELLNVADALPEFPCPHKETADIYRFQVQALLMHDLSKVQLCPSAIPEMKLEIIKYHMNSIHDRGTPIGLQAAEAYAAILTQLILNAFHKSGGAEASQGLDGVKDIMYARQNTSDPKVFCHFKDLSISIEDVIINYRKRFIGITVKDLIVKAETFSVDELQVPWWMDSLPEESKAYLHIKFDKSKMYQFQVTMMMLNNIIIKGTGNTNIIQSFYSSNNECEMLIFLKVKSQDIQAFLSEANAINSSCSNNLTVEPLPMNYKQNPTDNTDLDLMFIAEMTVLESIILNSFPCITIQGIQGVKSLQPVRLKGTIMSFVEQERLSERQWLITLTEERERETGLPIEKIILFLNELEFQVVRSTTNKNQLLVNSPDIAYKDSLTGGIMAKDDDNNYFKLIPNYESEFEIGKYISRNGYIYKLVNTDEVSFIDGIWQQKVSANESIERTDVVKTDTGIYIPVQIINMENQKYEFMSKGTIGIELSPSEISDFMIGIEKAKFETQFQLDRNTKRSKLLNYSMYVFAVAKIDLNNKNKNLFKQILCLPYIDKTRTYVNHMHLIANTLGIEASDYYVYSTLTNTLAAKDAYINSSMTTIITDSITNRGICYGATFNGISRQTAGHMSLASVEKAGDVMISAAMAGQKEDLRNTTAATYLGVRPSVGTGACHIAQLVVTNGVQRLVLNNELFTIKDDREQDIVNARNEVAMQISQRYHEQIRSSDFAVQDTLKHLEEEEFAFSSNYERYSLPPTLENVKIQGPPLNIDPFKSSSVFVRDNQFETVGMNSKVLSRPGMIADPFATNTRASNTRIPQIVDRISLGVNERLISRASIPRTSASRVSTSRTSEGRTPISRTSEGRTSRNDDDFVLEDLETGLQQANIQDAVFDFNNLDNIFG